MKGKSSFEKITTLDHIRVSLLEAYTAGLLHLHLQLVRVQGKYALHVADHYRLKNKNIDRYNVRLGLGQGAQPGKLERERSKIRPRDWSPDGEKMGKGVTLSKEELQALKELLNNLEV